MIAISNIVLRLSIKFAARGDVIVIASKSIAISHKTPSEHELPLYECVGTYEMAEGGGRRHKTSKRFIKYHTAEHCYDTSMQILFCVHEGAINDLLSLCSPFPLASAGYLPPFIVSSMIENATCEKVRERSCSNFRMINQPRENDISIRGL